MDPKQMGTWRYNPECKCWCCKFVRELHPSDTQEWLDKQAKATGDPAFPISGFSVENLRWEGHISLSTTTQGEFTEDDVERWYNQNCQCSGCVGVRATTDYKFAEDYTETSRTKTAAEYRRLTPAGAPRPSALDHIMPRTSPTPPPPFGYRKSCTVVVAEPAPKEKSAMRPDRWAGRDPSKMFPWFNPDCRCYWCSYARGEADEKPRPGEDMSWFRNCSLPINEEGKWASHVDYIEGSDPPKKEETLKTNTSLYTVTVYRDLARGETEAQVLVQPTQVFARGPQHATLLATQLVTEEQGGYQIATDTVDVQSARMPPISL